MHLATIDIVVLVVYALGLFFLAQFVSRDKAGAEKTSSDYFLASKSLPWWAIGASLIAANISAEQIVGMSGSGYAIGLAISSYEWMAALTLLIVGKFFLPIFLKNKIYTMPQFLEQRYGTRVRTLMAVFWLGLYVFVNLTAILWLGSIAVERVTGISQEAALVLLGSFALAYQFKGGPQGGGADRHCAGHLAGCRRTGHIAADARQNRCGSRRRCGIPHARQTRTGTFPYDPSAQQRILQGPPRYIGAGGRALGHEPQLLGVQSIHHSARIGRQESSRSSTGRNVCGLFEAADPGNRRVARHRGGAARAEPDETGSSVSGDDVSVAVRPARLGLCRTRKQPWSPRRRRRSTRSRRSLRSMYGINAPVCAANESSCA
jgi:Sodium:solute symporter family